MPPQNRFSPSFAERNRQSRVARGLEEERSVFDSLYRIPDRRDYITSHALDALQYAGTVTRRMTSESTAASLRWINEVIAPPSFHDEYVQRWEIPVPDADPLTQRQKNQIETIERRRKMNRPIDFWLTKEQGGIFIHHMETSHISNTLKVIWNHTRTPLIIPIRTYNFDRRVYTQWYITQVTMALLTELKKRIPDPSFGLAYDLIHANWANRGFITDRGLLGEKNVSAEPHTP